MTRLLDITVAAARPRRSARRCCSLAAVAIRLESPRRGDLPPPRGSAATACRSSCGSCARWSRAPSDGRRPLHRGPATPRITRVGRAAAALLAGRAAQPGQRAARRDVGRRAAPDRRRAGGPLHARTSAAGWRSSRGSPAGPRSTAARRSPGPSGSSSTSGTSTTAALRLDLRILRAHREAAGHRPGAVQLGPASRAGARMRRARPRGRPRARCRGTRRGRPGGRRASRR